MRIFALVLVLLLSALPAAAERRAAFVVGNSNYENAPRLANPKRDAALVAKTLEDLDFEVTRHYNLGRSEFASALGAFLRGNKDADVTLFYFAGHGMQFDGKNYLVGTDAKLETSFDVEGETIALSRVVEQLERHSKAALVFVDACRDNPLATDFYRRNYSETRALNTRGLVRERLRVDGSMLVFAAAPGQVAYDGDGLNSPFAAALARHLPTEGKEILTLTKRIIGDVREATEGAQSPIVTNDLTREIYLREAALRAPAPVTQDILSAPVTVAPPPLDPFLEEARVFAAAEEVGTPRAWALYFDRFPEGRLAGSGGFAEDAALRRMLRHRVYGRYHEPKPTLSDSEVFQASLDYFNLKKTEVEELQRSLWFRNLYKGAIDGEIGPQTRSSLVRHQRMRGLPSPGMLNRPTLASLGVQSPRDPQANRQPWMSAVVAKMDDDAVKILEDDPRIARVMEVFQGRALNYAKKDDKIYVVVYMGSHFSYLTVKPMIERVGGYLARIDSKEENDFLFQSLAHDDILWRGDTRAIGPSFGLVQSTGPNGTWTWTNGASPKFINWLPGEPNEARTSIFASFDVRVQGGQKVGATWGDHKTLHTSFIIEID